MIPINFPEATVPFGPPASLEESQCGTIRAYVGTVQGGSLDGERQIVVAWLPTEAERQIIAAGGPIYLSTIGGLVPHYLSTSFREATHPA